MSGLAHWEAAPFAEVIVCWDGMVARWGLDGDECSALLGVGCDGPIDDPDSYGAGAAERRMRLLVTFEGVVLSVHGGDGDRVRVWLRRPNPTLRGRTPIEVMVRSPDWIRWLIDAVGVAT